MFEEILDEAQKKIEEKYGNTLWVYKDWGKCDLYVGTYNDIVDLYELIHKRTSYFTNGFKFVPYDITKHGILKPRNAKEMFNEHFVLSYPGDIIEYEGKLYEAFGFGPNYFGAYTPNWLELREKGEEYESIDIPKDAPYKLIYSKKYDYHVKDRLRRLFR